MGFIYGARWKRLRIAQLKDDPWCNRCGGQACIVDHIKAHRGDEELGYDPDNLQSLCKPCHDSWKQMLEKSGKELGCSITGKPTDPNHPWNREQPTETKEMKEARLKL